MGVGSVGDDENVVELDHGGGCITHEYTENLNYILEMSECRGM